MRHAPASGYEDRRNESYPSTHIVRRLTAELSGFRPRAGHASSLTLWRAKVRFSDKLGAAGVLCASPLVASRLCNPWTGNDFDFWSKGPESVCSRWFPNDGSPPVLQKLTFPGVYTVLLRARRGWLATCLAWDDDANRASEHFPTTGGRLRFPTELAGTRLRPAATEARTVFPRARDGT